MPLRKDFMVTPLNESFDQAYTEENLIPDAAAGDCAAIQAAESRSEKSNFHVYYSENKRMSVQHFLQATSVIIGKKRFVF